MWHNVCVENFHNKLLFSKSTARVRSDLHGLSLCRSQNRACHTDIRFDVWRWCGCHLPSPKDPFEYIYLLPKGQKACLHVHNIFPYLYIRVNNSQDTNKFRVDLANNIDRVLNLSMGYKESCKLHHVYTIEKSNKMSAQLVMPSLRIQLQRLFICFEKTNVRLPWERVLFPQNIAIQPRLH